MKYEVWLQIIAKERDGCGIEHELPDDCINPLAVFKSQKSANEFARRVTIKVSQPKKGKNK